MENLSLYDLHKICRICLKTDLLVSIYSPTFLLRPVDMLTKLHILKLPLDDLELPTALCQSCLYRLLDAYNLQQLAEASEQRLREYLGFPSLPNGNSSSDINSCGNTSLFVSSMELEVEKTPMVETVVNSNGEGASDSSMYDNLCDMILDRNEVVEVVGGTDDVDLLNDVEIDVSSLTRSDADGDTDTFVDAVEAFEMNRSDSTSGPELLPPPAKDTVTRKSVARSPDQCGECGKIFHYRGYLTAHKRIHSGEKPFKCQLCPRQFAQSSKLRLHQRTHERRGVAASNLALTLSTIDETQKRDYCQQLAPIPDTVNDDDLFSNALKRFPLPPTRHQCSVCSAFFSTSSNLKAHASTHLEQRDFQCGVCERTFKSKRDLRRHEPIHKTVKDIICPLCSKAFTKRTYLNVHMLTVHRGIRRHKCHECGKVFANRSNLICHLRTHTGEKPFQCSFCPWKFNQSSGLARHLKKHSRNLNEKLNMRTTSSGGGEEDAVPHYEHGLMHQDSGSGLNDVVVFDSNMEHHHLPLLHRYPQSKNDFDGFETVQSLIGDNFPTSDTRTESSPTSFL